MKITERDVQWFTEGDCHYLARAINRRTGWPMAAFRDEEGWPDLHAFALMPNGRVLDVYGPQTKQEAKRRWKTRQPIYRFDWAKLSCFGAPPEYGQYIYGRAYTVADHLLAEMGR